VEPDIASEYDLAVLSTHVHSFGLTPFHHQEMLDHIVLTAAELVVAYRCLLSYVHTAAEAPVPDSAASFGDCFQVHKEMLAALFLVAAAGILVADIFPARHAFLDLVFGLYLYHILDHGLQELASLYGFATLIVLLVGTRTSTASPAVQQVVPAERTGPTRTLDRSAAATMAGTGSQAARCHAACVQVVLQERCGETAPALRHEGCHT
jgi:hypothetical protein